MSKIIEVKVPEKMVAKHDENRRNRLSEVFTDNYRYLGNYAWVVIRAKTIKQGGHVDNQERLTVFRYDVETDTTSLTMAFRPKDDMIADTLTLHGSY